MAGEKACSRLKSLSALAIAVCMTAVFSVFSISKTVSAAPLSTEAELQRFGVQGAVVCSTYGHNPNGFMARANDRVYIVDLKNNRIASIENPDAVFKDLDKDNSKKKGLFITQFLIQNDSYDKDHHYGEWRGSHHLIPMYILIDYDKNGTMVPADRIFSGEGASPGHYHGDIMEPKNIQLAGLLVSEILPFVQKGGFVGEMTPRWPGCHPGSITGNEVDIRTGPGDNYKSLGVFFKGDHVSLLNKITAADAESWYEVKYYNKQYGWIQGWVNGNYIKEND